MMEVGPWRVDGKGGLKQVEGGWEEYTTMVYSMSFAVLSLMYVLNLFDSRPTCWDRFLLHFVE